MKIVGSLYSWSVHIHFLPCIFQREYRKFMNSSELRFIWNNLVLNVAIPRASLSLSLYIYIYIYIYIILIIVPLSLSLSLSLSLTHTHTHTHTIILCDSLYFGLFVLRLEVGSQTYFILKVGTWQPRYFFAGGVPFFPNFLFQNY